MPVAGFGDSGNSQTDTHTKGEFVGPGFRTKATACSGELEWGLHVPGNLSLSYFFAYTSGVVWKHRRGNELK